MIVFLISSCKNVTYFKKPLVLKLITAVHSMEQYLSLSWRHSRYKHNLSLYSYILQTLHMPLVHHHSVGTLDGRGCCLIHPTSPSRVSLARSTCRTLPIPSTSQEGALHCRKLPLPSIIVLSVRKTHRVACDHGLTVVIQ